MKYGSKHPRGKFCLPIMLLGGVGVCMGERGKGHNTKYMAFFPALKAMCGAEKRNEVGGKNLFLNYRAPLHSLPLFPQEAPSPAHCFQLERGAGGKGNSSSMERQMWKLLEKRNK